MKKRVVPKQADEFDLGFLSAFSEQQTVGPRIPRHLKAFIRRGVRQDDDPKHIATLALELAGWWQSQWAIELEKRIKADARLAKLQVKKPRGRPPAELNLSVFAFPGSPGRPRKWTHERLRKLYKVVEREREALISSRRGKVTDSEALAAAVKRMRVEDGEITSERLVRADVRAWHPRYSEAKKLFGNPRKKIGN